MSSLKRGVGLANATVVSGSTLLHPVVVVGSSVVVVRISVVVVDSSVVAVDSSVIVEGSPDVIEDSVDDSIVRVDVGSAVVVSVDERKSEDSVLSEKKASDDAVVVKEDKGEVNNSEVIEISIEVVKERGFFVDGEEREKEGIEEDSSGNKSEVTVVAWSAGDEVDDCVGLNGAVVLVVSGKSSLDCDTCADERAVEDTCSGKVAVSVRAVFIVSAIVEGWVGSVVAVSAGSSPMICPFWHCSTISS